MDNTITNLRNSKILKKCIQENNQNILARFIFEQKILFKSNHHYSKFTALKQG